MNVPTKSLTIATLVAHVLTIVGWILVEVLEIDPRTGYLWTLAVIPLAALISLAILIYRLICSLWRTHLMITAYFESHLPDAPVRMINVLEREPYKLINSHITITYQDTGGKRVIITKTQYVEVLAEQITQLWERGIGIDPNQRNAAVLKDTFHCSVGKISQVDTEGQSYNVCSTLPEIRFRGDRFSREFSYVVENSYCAEEENFVLTGGKLVDHTTVVVKVPPPAQIHKPRVIYAPAGHRIPFNDTAPTQLSPDNLALTWSVDRAFLGEKFILMWSVSVHNNSSKANKTKSQKRKGNRKKKNQKGGALTVVKGGEGQNSVSPKTVQKSSSGIREQ